MKILLVAPPIMDNFGTGFEPIAMDAIRECPPYGMYLLQAELSADGHETALADLIASGTDSIANYSLDGLGLVAIGATSMSWPTALRVIAQVRQRRPNLPIVVGGIHPTMFDWYVLSAFDVDYVIRGEGETALKALARRVELGELPEEVPNLTWRTPDGRILRNPTATKMSAAELADAELPDYSQMPKGVYQGLSIESSRGCAFDCSFCSTSYRKSFRGMTPTAFVDRLQEVLRHQHRTRLPFTHIVDDEFSMNIGRAIKIAEEIDRRSMKPQLVYDSRATDLLTENLVEKVAPHTYQFLVGAECGYDSGLERIGKGTTTDILDRSAAMLSRYGIADRADYSFVLGLPWETASEVEQTCSFALRLHEQYGVRILLQWYCQIPGSRLWQDSRDRGDVSEAMYNEPGFFRSLYLFRSAVRPSNQEIERISRRIRLAADVASARNGGRRMVEYAHPEPLRLYFPPLLMSRPSDGLSNLRDAALADHRRRTIPPVIDLGPLGQRESGELNSRAGRPFRHVDQSDSEKVSTDG